MHVFIRSDVLAPLEFGRMKCVTYLSPWKALLDVFLNYHCPEPLLL